MGKKSGNQPATPSYGQQSPQQGYMGMQRRGSPVGYAQQAPAPTTVFGQAPPAVQDIPQYSAPQPTAPQPAMQSPLAQASTTETSLAQPAAPAALTPEQAQQQYQTAQMDKYSPVSRILRDGFQSGNR